LFFDHGIASMHATLHSSLVAFLCGGLAGCAILPAIGLNLAAQGAAGLAVAGLGPLVAMEEGAEKDRCLASANKGISITESLEIAIPAGEGEVRSFEPAFWRTEFAREGYPQVERSRTPTEGTLAITERSVLFVPPPGTASVRIPFELVQDVEARAGASASGPRSVIVRSCSGRFDIVTFLQRQSDNPDPATATVAAAQLKSRVAAFHAAAGN
jgi:hypothetical protein